MKKIAPRVRRPEEDDNDRTREAFVSSIKDMVARYGYVGTRARFQEIINSLSNQEAERKYGTKPNDSGRPG